MMEESGVLVGGLAMNHDTPSSVGRKYFMSIEKYQAKKEIREGK